MQTSKPKKLTAASLDEFPLIIAATPATKQERRVALAIILILTLVFAVIAPFASVQLPRVDAFVPALQTVELARALLPLSSVGKRSDVTHLNRSAFNRMNVAAVFAPEKAYE